MGFRIFMSQKGFGGLGVTLGYMSYSVNSLKGDYIGGNIGDYHRGY